MAKRVIFVIFAALLIFSRLYNLDRTTRFIWDESSDLVRQHQIYKEHKITLIGPISEDNSKVFGSLAYYLSLPGAIIGKFDPISPIWGTVLGGLVTAVCLLAIAKWTEPKRTVFSWVLIGLIVLTWFPLFQSSRSGLWAWHVSYIPMWLAAGLLAFQHPGKGYRFLTGLFFGLATYHHYLVIFTIISFSTIAFFKLAKQRDHFEAIALIAGFTISLLPFVIFDLRHPPGLFLTKFLYSKPVESTVALTTMIIKLVSLAKEMFWFFTQNIYAAFILGVSTLALLWTDLKASRSSLLWAAGWIGQLVGLIFIQNDGVSIHYLLPAAPFFLLWLIIPRPKFGATIANVCLLTIALSSAINLPKQMTTTNWQTDIPLVRFATRIIKDQVYNHNLENVNITVLASADNNTYGRRYRDVLLVNEVRMRSKDEYQYTDNLFVVSQESQDVIRQDPAYEMHNFRNGKLVDLWDVPNSDWHIYRFNRNPL